MANVDDQAEARFSALSSLFDPITFRHLEGVGIGSGWRCWEVGAGGVSVPAWMAERVGPDGHILASDIDTSRLPGPMAGVEVLVHDVAADEPPAGGFDLIHARLVLTHVPGRDRALRNLFGALRPGGWLVVEDFDTSLITGACLNAVSPDERRANHIRRGFLELLAARGVDLEYGRKLPALLRRQGLTDVAADAYFPMTQPGVRLLEQANTIQVAAHLVAAGHATEHEIAEHLRALSEGMLDVVTPPLVSAWGRKR
jgi:SAM-dependent methyltransferase